MQKLKTRLKFRGQLEPLTKKTVGQFAPSSGGINNGLLTEN